MITDIDLYMTIGVIMFYFLSEIYYYIESKSNEKIEHLRMEYYIWSSIIYITFACFVSVLTKLSLTYSMYSVFGLFLFVVITERIVYSHEFKIKFTKKQKPFNILVLSIIGIIALSSYPLITNTASLINGGVFGSSDNWFSETFMQMLSTQNVGAIITLMLIGSITILIAKSRHSSSMAVGGFFLVVGLPLFDLMDTLFNSDLWEEITDTALYTAFQNVALSLIIYVIIEMIFYMLVISIIISLLSQLDSIKI